MSHGKREGGGCVFVAPSTLAVASTTAMGHVLLQYIYIYRQMAENEAFTRKGSFFASKGQAMIDLPLPPITTKKGR